MLRKTFKVLVTHPEVPKPAIDLLRTKCEVLVCESVPVKREEVLTNSAGVDGILWAHCDPLGAEALDAAGKSLKVISAMTSGIDYVDIPEVKNRGILLGNTPGVVGEAVADLAIGLMIAAARRFHEGRRNIESGTWENWHLQWMLGQEIRGSTVGFLGFGGIGKATAKRLRGFDVGRILYTTRNRLANEKDYSATHVKFDELLKESDFLIAACPLTEETRGIFDDEAFNKMKSNCVFVNVARGPVVNQKALYDALKNNKIFAAGLDVMTPEPLPADDPLLTLPNCVMLPHLGTATMPTTTEMALIAARNILNGLTGQPMPAAV